MAIDYSFNHDLEHSKEKMFVDKMRTELDKHYVDTGIGDPKWIEIFRDRFTYEVHSVFCPEILATDEQIEYYNKNNILTCYQVGYEMNGKGNLIVD